MRVTEPSEGERGHRRQIEGRREGERERRALRRRRRRGEERSEEEMRMRMSPGFKHPSCDGGVGGRIWGGGAGGEKCCSSRVAIPTETTPPVCVHVGLE